MNRLVPVKMLTIIALDSLQQRLIDDLKACGIKGYTISEVQGEGLHSRHLSDWEGRNIKIETLAREEVLANILDLLGNKYFDKYSIIAFVSTVEVLRRERFLS
ncbi:MAG: P-II family nitrogen regulator [Bacteroidota bacterium]